MGSRFRIFFVLLCTDICQSGVAQTLGFSPPLTLSESDIYTAFGLPPLRDSPGTPAQTAAAATQVYKRAQALALTSHSAIDAWQAAETMLTVHDIGSASTGLSTTYSGSSASGLNQLLANPALGSIRVIGTALTIDQPIEIRRSRLSLDLGAAAISSASASVYMLRVENATDVSITGGNFVSGDSAILVNNSRQISVTRANISNLKGVGIVVTGSDRVSVTQNHISGLQLSGIMIHRGTTSSYIAATALSEISARRI